MALPAWTGAPLHALGGGLITSAAILIGIPGYIPLALVALGGWLREVLQHDLDLTRHQWIEALSWASGAAGAWLALEVLR